MAKLSNPFSFTRGPVTVLSTVLYAAIIVLLLVIQTSVPAAPKSSTPIHGVNLTEAWLDLQLLSANHHPYNSHENDRVRDWLLLRIETILADNRASLTRSSAPSAPAYVFNDTSCNITSSVAPLNGNGVSTYFESTNIIVYVRGIEDDKSEWWKEARGKPSAKNGVLVNAHYDSVSSGFGATDDGVGVVTILQLVRYYTTPGNAPKNGLVLLLNNGEEDFLNGARAFSQHPMSKLPTTFLNLEGAGAGGRATLFRSTDTEVTRAYAKSPYPFGTAISGDGFEKGFIRSQTDYVIFNGAMGLRGLDVAFFEPRARYHTSSDSTRHTNMNSVWHMLSAAVATTRALTTSSSPADSKGSDGVWFDIFGRVMVVFQRHTLFALAVTLLVVSPLVIILTMVVLYQADKLYLFSGSRKFHTREGDEQITLDGWRGLFRFPFHLLVACATPLALAYLMFKENPYIAYSSEWSVWSMMASSFIFVAWFLSRATDYARPSALTRAYGFTWFFMAWWALLVVGTIFENQANLAGNYVALFYFTSVFLATWLSYLELFSLPKMSKYCLAKFGEDDATSRSRSGSRAREILSASAREADDHEGAEAGEEEETSEQTRLLRGRSTFRKYNRTDEDEPAASDAQDQEEKHESHEQEWSKTQWSWLWSIQLLILAPINLILLGQVGLLIVASLHQTGADGSSMFLVYLTTAVFSILLFSPLVPILHRFTWHVPMFLFLVLVGTLIYNLIAFPFSSNNRLKLFFQQEIDLDSGVNIVSLVGVSPYVQDAISHLPSAAGQTLNCTAAEKTSDRERCSWSGLPPVVANAQAAYHTWLTYNVSRPGMGDDTSGSHSARFNISGLNTRACKLVLDAPIRELYVHGSSPPDRRFPPLQISASKEVRLWSRTWDGTWTVDVKWERDEGGIEGKVVCMWSDINESGVIPAYDEAMHFVPEWVAVTKYSDGLVEGYKRFKLD